MLPPSVTGLQLWGEHAPTSFPHRFLGPVSPLLLGVSQQKVRCRWTRDQAGALWVGDFEHGPPVMHQGRAVPTRLSAWIDCHSRYVVEACYYLREDFDVLVDSLLRAWTRHGASRELYVDNAKIYHVNALKLACAELNIKLLHRPPRDPPAGGLIERFFQTLQGPLEDERRQLGLDFHSASRRNVWSLTSFATLLARLGWPHKSRGGKLTFVCPLCGESRSDLNPRENLLRCFQRETNFNPIDLTMAARHCDFVEAVQYLLSLDE